MCRMTAPPCRPVAPVTTTVLSVLDMAQIYLSLLSRAAWRGSLYRTLTRLLGNLIFESKMVSRHREHRIELSPSINLFEGFQDLRIFRLNTSIHGDVVHRIFTE